MFFLDCGAKLQKKREFFLKKSLFNPKYYTIFAVKYYFKKGYEV